MDDLKGTFGQFGNSKVNKVPSIQEIENFMAEIYEEAIGKKLPVVDQESMKSSQRTYDVLVKLLPNIDIPFYNQKMMAIEFLNVGTRVGNSKNFRAVGISVQYDSQTEQQTPVITVYWGPAVLKQNKECPELPDIVFDREHKDYQSNKFFWNNRETACNVLARQVLLPLDQKRISPQESRHITTQQDTIPTTAAVPS